MPTKKKFNYEAGYRQLKKDYKKLQNSIEDLSRKVEVAGATADSVRYVKEVAIFHRHNEDGRVILP